MTRFSEEWYARRMSGAVVDTGGALLKPTVKPAGPVPYERDVLAAILEYLPLCPRVAWFKRMNVGAVEKENADGSKRYLQFAFKGCSDIIGQMKDGRFLAIEVKRTGRRTTDEQAEFLRAVNNANGIGIVATSIEDVRGVCA